LQAEFLDGAPVGGFGDIGLTSLGAVGVAHAILV
jgi:hypothetical protein